MISPAGGDSHPLFCSDGYLGAGCAAPATPGKLVLLPGSAEERSTSFELIIEQWEDILRVAGSLSTGTVRASELMRALQGGGRATRLGRAIAELGRVAKTLHLRSWIDSEEHRRQSSVGLTRHEGRHSVARVIFHGNQGELRQPYREGQEDQLGALGFALNALVLWNAQYLDDAIAYLRATGHEITDEDLQRLSPLQYEHIKMLGNFPFRLPDDLAAGPPRGQPHRTAEAVPAMTTATALTGRRLTGVSEVILAAVTIGCHRDIDWLYRGAGRFYPEAWERFLAGVPGTPRDGDILAAYARLLEDPDPAVREQAAIDWCAWEDALLSSETQGSDGVFSGREPLARMALVRICAHYFSNGVFLEDRVLIREAGRLAGIPGVLCTAASTSAGRSRPPGSCRGPGRTPSC